MQKNMYFDYFGGDCFAAVTEGDRLVEFHLDPAYALDISGNIYKGRVVNVLEGMQAAFVSFGQAKNGYLAAGDIPCAEGEPARVNVSVGDEVMVKVLEIDDKGRLNLSRRDALIEVEGLVPENEISDAPRRPRRDHGPRREDRPRASNGFYANTNKPRNRDE